MICVQNINLQIHGKTISKIEYIYFVISKIRSSIQQILILNEIIDTETLQSLTQIQDLINMHFDSANKYLIQISYGLFALNTETKELIEKFNKNYKLYAREYHHFARKKTLNRIQNSAKN